MSERDRQFDRKWTAVAGIWSLQAIALVVGPGLLVQESLPLDWFYLRESRYLLQAGILFLLVIAAQAVLLWPVRRPAPRMNSGASAWVSVGTAALACALLIGGGLAAAADLVWLATDQDIADPAAWAICGATLLTWALFTPLLMSFCRQRRRETALARLASRLFLGTIIEAAAIIPLDVMVRRKASCYCGHGTYWALIICGSVGFFALGPAVLLPIVARRRKRWYAGHCDACGYDMSGTPGADRCPECGAGWRADRE